MSDFLKILLRKNSLRKNCQDLSVVELEKVIADLSVILEERKVEEEQRLEVEREKAEKIELIRKTAEEAGLSYNDLQSLLSDTPKKKVEAKYRITDADGNEHVWSGRGRTPVAFQEYFDKNGVTKEDCLIK